MSITPAGELLFSAPVLFAIGSSLFVMVHFLRKPDLVKARFFLNFPRFRRFFVAMLVVGALAISASALSALTGRYGEELLESWDGFVRFQAPTLLIYAGIGAWILETWRVLR